MAQTLFFVPEGGSTKRQKELIYAACKAHVAKIAHQRRRETKSVVEAHIKDPRDGDRGLTDRKRQHHNQRYDENCTSHKLSRVDRSTSSPHCLLAGLWGLPDPCPGSYDPLGCPSTATSAQVVNVIRFAQFHLEKSWSPPFMLRLTGTWKGPTSFEKAAKLNLTDLLWNLWASDTGLFWAVLASVVPLMARHTSGKEQFRLQSMAMELKARSLADLRTLIYQLTNSKESNPLTAAYHVKALFREACASGDMNAARQHARIVEQLSSMLMQKESDLQCSRLALWSDALPALLQMRRPVVQYSAWMSPIIEKIWIDAEKVMPDLECDSVRVQRYICNRTIRKAFRHLRRSLQIINSSWLASEDQGQDRQVELTFRWMTTKAEHHICRLLDTYLDTIELLSVKGRDPTAASIEPYMELAFSLSLLYFYQKNFFIMEWPDGMDFHESGHIIYPHLKSAIQQAQLHCSGIEQNFYKEAFFWLVFTGSQMERSMKNTRRSSVRSHLSDSGLKQAPTWFRSQLMTYRSHCGLQSWTDARNVLIDFAWDDFYHPDVGKWYEHLCPL